MTPQEATKWLIGIEEKYIHGGDEGFDENRKVAIKTAISALEKQIPKKCTGGFHKEKLIDGRCPNCSFRQSKGDIQWKRQFNKYCRNCGQALDWGEE